MQVYGVACGPKEIKLFLLDVYAQKADLDAFSAQHQLQDGLEYVKDRKGKIYEMEFEDPEDDNNDFVLSTTEKNIWLRLGELTVACHENMAVLLKETFADQKCNRLLLQLYVDEASYLVTMTKDPLGGLTVFSFSIAH